MVWAAAASEALREAWPQAGPEAQGPEVAPEASSAQALEPAGPAVLQALLVRALAQEPKSRAQVLGRASQVPKQPAQAFPEQGQQAPARLTAAQSLIPEPPARTSPLSVT